MDSARALPRPAMLREMTDASVLAEVIRCGRVTRVGLADATGISGPTVWESVRRLADAGLLRDAGSQETRGRGRAATYYQLSDHAGWVLGLTVSQQGVHAHAADMAGRPIADSRQQAVSPTGIGALLGVIGQVVAESLKSAAGRGTLRAVAISVAAPVRSSTPEIIAMAGSWFPDALLLPAEGIACIGGAPLLVDNDVNLAALAERETGPASEVSSFAYVHVGSGLGLAVYAGGQLIRGAHGLAGEISYLPVGTSDGVPVTLAERLARQGLNQPDGPLMDVDAVLGLTRKAAEGDSAAGEVIRDLGAGIGHAVTAACVIADPEIVLLGGPIGSQPALLAPVRAAVARFSPAMVLSSQADESAPLRGAVRIALEQGRKRMVINLAAPG